MGVLVPNESNHHRLSGPSASGSADQPVRLERPQSQARGPERSRAATPVPGTLIPLLWLALALAVCAAVLYWFPPEQYALYPRCLLYHLTGLQCPGCGGLRAAHQLLHGHWAAAFELNPIVVMLVPLAGLFGLGRLWRCWTGRDWLRPFRGPVGLWCMLGAILVFTILRNWPVGGWLRR
jgi:hypothetical protein